MLRVYRLIIRGHKREALLTKACLIACNNTLPAFADTEEPSLCDKDADGQLVTVAEPPRHSRRVAATAASTPQILVGGSLDPIAEEQEEGCSPDTEGATAEGFSPSARKEGGADSDMAVPAAVIVIAVERDAAEGGAPPLLVFVYYTSLYQRDF